MSATLFDVLLEASLRSLALAGLVMLLLLAARVRAGGLRHAAWTAVLAGMLLMPVLARIAPVLTVPLPSAPVTPVATVTSDAVPSVPVAAMGGRTASATPAVSEVPATTSTALEAAPQIDVWAGVGRIAFDALAFVYVSGAFLCFVRLFVGWRAGRRIHRQSRRVFDPAVPGELQGVFESALVATPVTVGLIAPRVVLPAGWTTWAPDKLHAVLAHERAHVRRRDAIVTLLAHVNRCVFWFHPLAWWLERMLATAAEHACDDEVVRTLGAPRRYAEVLLDMAETVRRSGGRVVWQGVGMDGASFGRRLDRILSGAVVTTSRTQRCVVAASCAMAVVIAVACGQQERPMPPPLQDNPEISRIREANKERSDAFRAASTMTARQAAELEARWQQNPEDLQALERLLIFYRPDFSGNPVPDADRRIAARRRLILWLVEHHPDHPLAGSLDARIFAEPSEWLRDTQGYEAVKALWLRHASNPGVRPETLANAARFLDVTDKPIAERMLLQGQKADGQPVWSHRLGELYAQMIVGSSSFTLYNVIRSVSLERARGPEANAARRKLAESTDARLLAAAGCYLAQNASQAKLDFDHRELGRSYLERAVALDPGSRRARQCLQFLEPNEFNEIQALLGKAPRDSWPEILSKLPEDVRLRISNHLATETFMSAEYDEWRSKNPPNETQLSPEDVRERAEDAQNSWRLSKQYAGQALELANRLTGTPGYPDSAFKANIALGAHAFREGDRQTAVRYMLDAAKAYASRTVPAERDDFSLEGRLIGQLLKHGERATVIEYFELLARPGGEQAERPRKAAEAIRNGYWPIDYGLGH